MNPDKNISAAVRKILDSGFFLFLICCMSEIRKTIILFTVLLFLFSCSGKKTGETGISSQIDKTVKKAAAWIYKQADENERFDSLIMLNYICRYSDEKNLIKACRIIEEKQKEDDDNPFRRIWDPEFRSPEEYINGWAVPEISENRVNVNRVMLELLYCSDYGIRNQTLNYIENIMLDGGGYHTTHGLWAIVLSAQNGCLSDEGFRRLADPYVEELYDIQPEKLNEISAEIVDLFAERTVMILMSVSINTEYSKPEQLRHYISVIAEAQNKDGCWGSESENPDLVFHSALLCVWALQLFNSMVI